MPGSTTSPHLPEGRRRDRRPARGALARAATAVAAALMVAASLAATAMPIGLAAPAGVFVVDDFESPAWPDPAFWTPGAPATDLWWPSSCRSRTGARSLWAFGRRADGVARLCGEAVPGGTTSTTVQRLDLRGTRAVSRLELQFDVWMHLPGGEAGSSGGLFVVLVAPAGGSGPPRVPVFGATGTPGEWVFPARQLDLMNLADITDPRKVYDLRGGDWRLEWQAITGAATAPGGGVFVDDVRLVWEPDAAFPTPTRGAGATVTASATATIAPSATAGPTAVPTGTATPSASATATRGPVTATATAAAGGTATVTPTATTTDVPPEATPTPAALTARAWLPAAYWELPPPTETPSATPMETGTPTPVETPGAPPAETPTAAASTVPTAAATPQVAAEVTLVRATGAAVGAAAGWARWRRGW